MSDLIDRQAAIDALTDYWHGIKNRYKALDGEMAVYCDCKNIIKNLSPAQPTHSNTLNALDCISRQAAIDALDEIEAEVADGYGYQYAKWREYFVEMPSAQPEIVRCAECNWFQCNMQLDGYLPKGVDEFECRHWCGSCDPTDFCSYAERKGEEDEDEGSDR